MFEAFQKAINCGGFDDWNINELEKVKNSSSNLKIKESQTPFGGL